MYNPNLGRWMTLDPIGFTAGDVNLYRSLSNAPTSRLDPTGFEDSVSVSWGAQKGVNFNTEMGTLEWSVTSPKPPAKINTMTHVKMRWKTWNGPASQFCASGDRPDVQGDYEFWFEGIVDLGKFQFTLSPGHGSHIGADNTGPYFPTFLGKTLKDKELQLQDYLARSRDTHGSRGELEFLIEYRGYSGTWKDKFNPILSREEDTGPFLTPTSFDDPIHKKKPDVTYYIPNWIRSKNILRRTNTWSETEPLFWSLAEPEWEYTKSLSLQWGRMESGDGTSIDYTMRDGDRPPVKKSITRKFGSY